MEVKKKLLLSPWLEMEPYLKKVSAQGGPRLTSEGG